MSGPASAFQQAMPNLSQPFLDGRGCVVPVWQRLFRSLLDRTGGTAGSDVTQVAARAAAQANDAAAPGLIALFMGGP